VCSSDLEDGSVFYICCWPLPVQSFSGPSPLGLVTMFCCLSFDTSFSSPPTTRRVMVEVFDPVSTRSLVTSLISLPHGPHRKHSLYCWNIFTEALHSNGRGADPIKTFYYLPVFTVPLLRSGLHNTVSLLRISRERVTIFYRQMYHVLRVRVCSETTTVTFGHGINLNAAGFSVRVWAGIVGDIIVGPCLLSDKMSWDFPGNCDNGATWICASNCEEVTVVFQLKRTISRKVDWTLRIELMVCSVARSSSDAYISLVGTENAYPVAPGTIEDLVARPQAAVTRFDAKIITACSRECRAAHCRLPSNGRRQLRISAVTTRRPWFDSFISCAIWRWRVSWKLNFARHTLYNAPHFIKQGITLWRACTRISFHPQLYKML
jgi:hypothetical protein